MHTKLHDLVKPLLLALVLGLLSGCGGSSSDSSDVQPLVLDDPDVPDPVVYTYDLPAVAYPSSAFPTIVEILTQVDRTEYTITYANVSASVATQLRTHLRDVLGYTDAQGLLTSGGGTWAGKTIITKRVFIEPNGNGLYTVDFSVILAGRDAISGPGFFAGLFILADDFNAPVVNISTTYYYDVDKFLGIPLPQVPPSYAAYKTQLSLAYFSNDSLGNGLIPFLPPFITALDPFAHHLFKSSGNFRYDWNYDSSALGFYGSVSRWSISKL
jgi:hypothetical protein